MKNKSKIIEIPTGYTIIQIENALNNLLNQGYSLIQVTVFGTKTYAILIKRIAE
jgi:hypothetical protein